MTNVTQIRQLPTNRERDLIRRVADLEREVSRLRARALAENARTSDDRLCAALHEAHGEIANLRFAIGEVVTNYRCVRNASANGHDALAAEYRLRLASWVDQCGDTIGRPDTLYGRFKNVLTR